MPLQKFTLTATPHAEAGHTGAWRFGYTMRRLSSGVRAGTGRTSGALGEDDRHEGKLIFSSEMHNVWHDPHAFPS